MKLRRSSLITSLVLSGLLLLPPLPFYFGLASSLALGTSAAAVIAICGWLVQRRHRVRDVPMLSSGVVIGVVVISLVGHACVAAFILPVNGVRAILSVAPLALLLAGAYSVGQLIATTRQIAVHQATHVALLVLCAVALLPLAQLFPSSSRLFFKPVFPFSEPSLYSLVFTPLLLYRCVTTSGASRFLWLAAGFAIALHLESLTLIAGCLLVLIATTRSRLIIVPIVLSIGVATQLNLEYYIDRLNFSGDSRNLSTLVYLQGWQLIQESWLRSSGWGLGFQQLGVLGTDVSAANLIFELLGEPLNLLDGSFLFAKFVSELGAIGLLISMFYLIFAVRALRSLRATAQSNIRADAAVTLARSFVVGYLIEFFVRGSGYFSGTSLLLIASFYILSSSRATARSVQAVDVRLFRAYRAPVSPNG